MEQIRDPCLYFHETELAESFLLRFRYRPSTKVFDLVFDYAADILSVAFENWPGPSDPAPPRDLRWIRFLGVQSLFLNNCRCPDKDDFYWTQYEKKVLEIPRLILGAQASRGPHLFWCTIHIQDIGTHRFDFESATTKKRLCYVKKVTDSWAYFDMGTNEHVDYFNPFPEIDE